MVVIYFCKDAKTALKFTFLNKYVNNLNHESEDYNV